ncbi:MAG: BMC domain-containing protein [Clostridium sp.]|uniref:BMC domain-containing protein n=1 Tax=Clostridium TaxID=1485 RepID=UPI00189A1EF4|nr:MULTISPECIES: BMC domain-containing protein [Clostridium]MDU4318552.1 BMC domain-containing protein [Clostridium sp.]MDU5209274.1 BMC domain-containing protein [Clostridium sp.]MDU6761582.1 BMC domain-containing protein [Clostridium sp.]
MQALGLLETKGLIAAVEGADIMVKAADVSILEKSYVGGGLVTITITGDVGAVKASIEAGVAAVKKLGSEFLISNHVIPRPHNELGMIIETKTIQEREETKEDSTTDTDIIKNDTPLEDNTESITTVISEESELVDDENLIIVNDISKFHKEDVDKLVQENGLEETIATLGKLKVTKLRNLAREYNKFEIVGRQISKANKNVLIEKFKLYYEKK